MNDRLSLNGMWKNIGAMHEMINPDQLSKVDIAVLIPSYNEAKNIGLVVKKASAGLKKYYPDLSSVVVNCDNNSADNTKEAFFNAECEVPRIYASTSPGYRGKGGNLRNAFQIAADLSAKVVIIFDANLISIKTTWIPSLVDPILSGTAEYVTPLYVRHRYDAPLTRGLAYPIMRALFGRRVFQPICIDHAFSGRVNQIYLNTQWDDDDRGYKSDLKMLSTAIINQIPICQSFMAHPRISTVGKLDRELDKAFGHTVKAIFDLMVETSDFWLEVKRSRPTILAGADESPKNPAPQVEVNRAYLLNSFIELSLKAQKVWPRFLSPELNLELMSLINQAQNGGTPPLNVDLWCQVLFESALAYKNSDDDSRLELSSSLTPLFFLKGLTVNILSEGMSQSQYSSYLENEALCFEASKKDLGSVWGQS